MSHYVNSVIFFLQIDQIEDIIKDVDIQMGSSKCKYAIQSLEFPYDSQKSDLIDQSSSVVCSGQLKNDRGTVSCITYHLTLSFCSDLYFLLLFCFCLCKNLRFFFTRFVETSRIPVRQSFSCDATSDKTQRTEVPSDKGTHSFIRTGIS